MAGGWAAGMPLGRIVNTGQRFILRSLKDTRGASPGRQVSSGHSSERSGGEGA